MSSVEHEVNDFRDGEKPLPKGLPPWIVEAFAKQRAPWYCKEPIRILRATPGDKDLLGFWSDLHAIHSQQPNPLDSDPGLLFVRLERRLHEAVKGAENEKSEHLMLGQERRNKAKQIRSTAQKLGKLVNEMHARSKAAAADSSWMHWMYEGTFAAEDLWRAVAAQDPDLDLVSTVPGKTERMLSDLRSGANSALMCVFLHPEIFLDPLADAVTKWGEENQILRDTRGNVRRTFFVVQMGLFFSDKYKVEFYDHIATLANFYFPDREGGFTRDSVKEIMEHAIARMEARYALIYSAR